MKLGVNYRHWGPHASRENLLKCAGIADNSTLDSMWVNDHIGFPPGEWNNEYGVSNDMGNIVDPYATMAFLSAVTNRIEFGSAVIIGPYRPPLPTAKWLQSIQHLSDNRMNFGVGVGYLTEEFTALGVPKTQRGRLTDELLDFLHIAFDKDFVECNGQKIALAPKTKRPPFLIGGNPDIAIPRAIKRGDGWMPVFIDPDVLKPLVQRFQKEGSAAGRGQLEVVAMKTLPIENISEAIDLAKAYQDAGATHLVSAHDYSSPSEYQEIVDVLSNEVRPEIS